MKRILQQPSTSATSEPPSFSVAHLDEAQNPSFDAAVDQPQPSGSSSTLVEVHHNMGSQENLVDEDFLAQMENHTRSVA